MEAGLSTFPAPEPRKKISLPPLAVGLLPVSAPTLPSPAASYLAAEAVHRRGWSGANSLRLTTKVDAHGYWDWRLTPA